MVTHEISGNHSRRDTTTMKVNKFSVYLQRKTLPTATSPAGIGIIEVEAFSIQAV